MNKNIIQTIFFIIIVTSIPFLEFFQFNYNNINNNYDLQINFLTIKRLFGFYLFLLILLILTLFFLSKIIHLNKFDLVILISFCYWLIFKYNDIKKIFNFEFLKI